MSNNGTNSVWTPYAKELVKTWVLEGYSRTVIIEKLAETVGIAVTRNAVIGLTNRMGLTTPRPTITAKKPSKKHKQPKKAKSKKAETPVKVATDRFGEIELTDLPPETIGEHAVSLIHVCENQCRWPFGDPEDRDTFLFCGDLKLSGYSYCPRHCRLAYTNRSTVRRPFTFKPSHHGVPKIHEPALGLSAGSEAAAGLADQYDDQPLSSL